MRYTWRITFTGILLINNLISLFYFGNYSSLHIFSYLINITIFWFIGYQIDKYRFSRKELGSTKTVLSNYSYALNSAADAIAITSEKGLYEFVNEAHSQLYGYDKNELLNKSWKTCNSQETNEYLLNTANPHLLKYGHWRGEIEGVKKDGTTFPLEVSLSRINDTKKTLCVIRNISERKQNEEYMRYIAEHNELTNLPNRRRLLIDLEKSKEEAKNTTLLFIDLDRFKNVNDTLGHDAGDVLLQKAAERLTTFQNEDTQVYHHGGDEFIILIHNTKKEYVTKLAHEIVESIKKPIYINENEVIITTSIGISSCPDDSDNNNDLIKMADTAMYHAKLKGKNTYKFFNNDLKLKLERRTLIEAELRKAIKNKEFYIFYQPKLDLCSSKLVGIEALIRWNNPNLGIVPPLDFIPIAEDTGIIVDIGKWVINEVLKQMKLWQEQGYPLVKISVNVSQRQFRDENLVKFIQDSLNAVKIDAEYFEIEVTESVFEDLDLVIPKLNALKEIGIGISIDDFGTGFSSLNLLKDLPIDTLKIDQSFIRDLIVNTKDNALVQLILEIGIALNLRVVAEGVETEEHLQLLKSFGCPIGQGYYFSAPIPASELEAKFLKVK
jgi:diguanylate cyclase